MSTAKDPTIVLPPDAAQLVPSRFHIDVQIEKATSLLGKPKLAWRQCCVEGQRLQILDNSTVFVTMATPQCTLREHKPVYHTYKLQDDAKTTVVLYLPSATVRTKLGQVLELSKQSPYWVLPASNELNDRLAVAAAIVETEEVLKKPRGAPSGVTMAQVRAYLGRLKPLYDALKDSTPEHMYAVFLEMEADYVKNPTTQNLAEIAHKLHPLDYAEYTGKTGTGMRVVQYGRVRPLRHYLRSCPHPSCAHPWSISESYQLHIENQTLVCPQCHSLVNYDMYKVAALVADIPEFVFNGETYMGSKVSMTIQNPGIPNDGQLKTYLGALSKLVKEQEVKARIAASFNQVQCGIRTKLERYLSCDMGRFHVDLVRGMFRLWELVKQVGPEFAYWSEPIVIQAAIARYQKYMRLVLTTPSKVREVPTADIALVMHAHQTDHEAYFAYYRKATNNSLFAYSDHGENWDFEPSYAEMFIRWAEAYDEPYSSAPPSFDAWMTTKATHALNLAILKKKWAKHARLPAHDSRFVGVDSYQPPLAATATMVPAEDGAKLVFEPMQEPEATGSGYVLGSPVTSVVPLQQSRRLSKLLEEDGYLCSERNVG